MRVPRPSALRDRCDPRRSNGLSSEWSAKALRCRRRRRDQVSDELEENAEARSLSKAFGLCVDAVGYASIEVGDLTALRNHAESVKGIDIPAPAGAGRRGGAEPEPR